MNNQIETPEWVVEANHITKVYQMGEVEVHALRGLSTRIAKGEIVSIMGPSGSGKSTLMKIMAGSYNDYTGQILINGQEVELNTPAKAKEKGIGMIYQELSLATSISIAENMLVGRLPLKNKYLIDKKGMIDKTNALLKKVGLEHLDPMLPVEEISQHEAQLVEIAKVLGNDPHIIVMDEPTSALSRTEVKRLYQIINKLKQQGLAIIFISHHLSEVFNVADRVTVMRDGNKIATSDIDDVTSDDLVEMMVGHKVDNYFRKKETEIGNNILQVKQLTRYGFFHDVSFQANKGEILSIIGLAGAGRTELGRSMVGLDPIDKGEIIMNDKEITPKSLTDSLDQGLGYLTEDRKIYGLFLRLTMKENLLASVIPQYCNKGIYQENDCEHLVDQMIDDLEITPAEPSYTVNELSGGNQQKVLLGKWLATQPQVLILDEPTRGVDVGAKKTIHDKIIELAEKGITIILISSDLPELVKLSDRAIVMRQGYLIGEIKKEDLNEENALLAANGEGELCNVCRN